MFRGRKLINRVFSHDVTAAILVSQNNETAAMLVSQTNPVGVELFSYANASVNSTCAQPPPGNRGAFASLVSPGGGALANLARPGGRALANPGGTPGLLTRTLLTLKRGQHGEFPR